VSISLKDSLDVNIIESSDFVSDICRLVDKKGTLLLVTSSGFTRRGTIKTLLDSLDKNRVVVFDKVTPNPEKAFIQKNYQEFSDAGVTDVLAIGGGSVIDTAKVFSAMLSFPKQSLEQLLTSDTLSCKVNLIAVPTTAGTGAEVTLFATVWDSVENKKFSLYGVKPTSAILDPALTLTLPYSETLYPALDALSHSLESVWNKNKTATSEHYALDAIDEICEVLPIVLVEPNNAQARRRLQYASTLAGLAISINRTALAHAISYPLTSKYAVPHGLACSFTLQAIVNVFGHRALDLNENTADKVNRLLNDIDFDKELQQFVTWQEIQNLASLNFDQSRTGNFIQPLNNELVSKILVKSQQMATVVRHL
jgi:phosphonate metabolism-associated iron-containing alcohol dehydrogenase